MRFEPETLETVKGNLASQSWAGLLVEEVRYTSGRRVVLAPEHHLLTVHLGSSLHLCQERAGSVSREQHTHGDLTITPAGQQDRRAWDSSCHALHFWLSQDYLTQIAEETTASSSTLTLKNQFLVRDSFIEQLATEFQDVLKHPTSQSGGTSLYAESLRHVLATYLLRHFGTDKEPVRAPQSKNGLCPTLLEKLRHFVTAHLDDDLTLPRLSEAVGISQFHLARVFKEATGMTLHQFVIDARVERAKHLLASGTDNAADIAYQVGFGSQSLLNRRFKQLVGTTPAAFARARRR